MTHNDLPFGATTASAPRRSPASDLLTVTEAAAYLRVCTKTVRKLARAGTLPSARIGRQIRFSRRGLDLFLNNVRTGSK